MASLQIVKNTPPKLAFPNIVCDRELDSKLRNVPLFQLMNKSTNTAVIGPPGSGKSTLVQSMLKTKKLFWRVFDTILVFIPESSRKSCKDSIMDGLPEDQIISQLTEETLLKAEAKAKANAAADPPKSTCIIFDDQQDAMTSSTRIRDALLRLMSNRRHNYCTIISILQSWKKLPKKCRAQLSDVFLFNISREDFDAIYREVINKSKHEWEQVMRYYHDLIHTESMKLQETNEVNKRPHHFLYLNTDTTRWFVDFNELITQQDKQENSMLDNCEKQAEDTKHLDDHLLAEKLSSQQTEMKAKHRQKRKREE